MIWSTHHVVGRLSVVGRGGVQGSTEWEKHPTFRGAGWRLDPFVLVHTQTNSKIDQFLFVFHLFCSVGDSTWWNIVSNVWTQCFHFSSFFFFGSLQVTNVSCKNTFLQFLKKKHVFPKFYPQNCLSDDSPLPHTHKKSVNL